MRSGEFDRTEVEKAISSAFSPHSPINQASLFRGRTEQIRSVVDAVRIPGLHAAIYGERGVGKTSLANMIKDFLSNLVTTKVNCTEQDTFTAVLHRCLDTLVFQIPDKTPGLVAKGNKIVKAGDYLPAHARGTALSPDLVANVLSTLQGGQLVLIIDEFDRLERASTTPFSDFIKALSDRGAAVTVVLVGVAEDINALIASHASVERCLRQVYLQRMSNDALTEIVRGGLKVVGMELESQRPLKYILSVAQGFPHYTHLLAQNAARAAVDLNKLVITAEDVNRWYAAGGR